MKKIGAFVLMAVFAFPVVIESHPGNVRRSDCTHVDRKTGNRHRHTGRPYCNQGRIQILTPEWFHH